MSELSRTKKKALSYQEKVSESANGWTSKANNNRMPIIVVNNLKAIRIKFTWIASTRYPDKIDTHTVKMASHPIASQAKISESSSTSPSTS